MDPAERKAAALGIIGSTRRKLLKEVDDFYGKRDAIIFSGLAEAKSEKVVEFTSGMEAAREKLRRLSFLAWEDIEIVREKKLSLAKPNTEGRFLDPVTGDPALAAAAGQVDYLVFGTVEEELAGYYSVTAQLYGVLAEKVLYSGHGSGELDEMDRVVDELFQDFATAVAGRDWAVLDVTAEPKDAGVFIDGKLAGIGKARLAYATPGVYKVEVKAAGYGDGFEEVVLIPGAREKRNLKLPPLDAAKIILNAIPPGASFYRGSLRVGNVPLVVEESGKPEISRLQLEGYKDEIFTFPSDNDYPASSPSSGTSSPGRTGSRKSGRTSTPPSAGSCFPCPFPSFSTAFSRAKPTATSNTRVEPTIIRQARGMAEKRNILYYSYLGSLFVSGSLLLNTIIKLMDYNQRRRGRPKISG